MGSTRSIFALVILAAGCSKEGGGGAEEKGAPQGDLRVAIGDCAAPEVAFVSGPNPRPAAERAQMAGVIGMLGTTQGGAFASLTGTGDISSGLDDKDVYGGLLGNEVGEMNGGFGYGISGTGSGQGGTGWGTIGTGRYGTIGHGSGTGSGYGVGSGRGMRGRSAAVPNVRIGNADATGSLDKNIIRRYIRRKLPAIRYCYEKQLLVKPKLAGTVKASFVIAETGNVVVSSADGMDGDVSRCIATAIKSIEFPKPKGGGVVKVNYPFTFRPAEGSAAAAEEPASSALLLAMGGAGNEGADGDMSKRRPGADLGEQIANVREEGQYKMKRVDEDPQLAKQQALEAAVSAGVLGTLQEQQAAPASAVGGGDELGGKSPLRGHEAALGACFRKQEAAHGVAVVDLTYDAAGAVTGATLHGVEGAEVTACVAEAAKTMKRVAAEGTAQRCSVAFGTLPAAEAPGVDITSDAILFGGKKLLDPAAVMMDASAELKLAPLFEAASVNAPAAAPVSLRGPMVIRPIGDARMKVVNRVLATLVMADAHPVFAAQDGAGWRTLTDVALPVVPVPAGTGGPWHGTGGASRDAAQVVADAPVPQLSILVAADKTVWVGTTAGDVVKLAPAADQAAQLDKALRDHRASAAFASRADLEIAAEDEVTYGAVVAVIDAAARVGFTRWAVLDPASASVRFKQ
ncbi:MAG TPA: AgmX/PglI C-terminal domain-containing protein [Kofleriaceae bacterium]|nr:AgmX/PglI C-terminal domain-containing protein [Kofleriaceae bacterium]